MLVVVKKEPRWIILARALCMLQDMLYLLGMAATAICLIILGSSKQVI